MRNRRYWFRKEDKGLALCVMLTCDCIISWDSLRECWQFADVNCHKHSDIQTFWRGSLPSIPEAPSREVVAAGYAMAASRGVGPWAPFFPREDPLLLHTQELLSYAIAVIEQELVRQL